MPTNVPESVHLPGDDAIAFIACHFVGHSGSDSLRAVYGPSAYYRFQELIPAYEPIGPDVRWRITGDNLFRAETR